MEPEVDVVVVGGGLAGLVAAHRLQAGGMSVVVCESSDDIGGRVRTDVVDGFRLDRGFQVLLPGYPAVRECADVAALRPQPFTRGVVAVAQDGRRQTLVPPWPNPRVVADLLSFVGRRPRDVAGLAALSLRDLTAPDRTMRALPEHAIDRELARWGVSARTVNEVLRPFLAGVLLDPSLQTSSRLFHLIWRSFLRGAAALPAAGMGALPHHLATTLNPGTIRLGTEVVDVSSSGVTVREGSRITARAVVVATDGTTAARLLPGVSPPDWHAVTTFYYRAPSSPLGAPTLVVDSGDLLINTAVLSDVAPSYAPEGQSLVAASVPESTDDSLQAQRRVRTRLSQLYDTATGDWELLAVYPIAHALPVMGSAHPLRRPVRLGRGLYVCGDHRDTSSVQGALVSGRRAATAALADLHTAA